MTKIFYTCCFTVLLLLSIFSSSCLSAYGFQTGRSLGRGVSEVTLDAGFISAHGNSIMAGGVSARAGLEDKFDVGVVPGIEYFFSPVAGLCGNLTFSGPLKSSGNSGITNVGLGLKFRLGQ